MTGVLTAVGNRWDVTLATTLEAARDVELVRRCADLADLLATAAAGMGAVAIVSEDLRGLDLTVVSTLAGHGVAVVGASLPADEGSERRLRQLGAQVVLPVDAGRDDWEEAVRTALLRTGVTPGGSDVGGGVGDIAVLPGGPAPARGLDALGGDGGPLAETSPTRGRIVAVWGPTGAPGRTTVAVNLAAELAALGVPTLLVDADTYGGSVAQSLSMLDEAPGLAAATRAADQGTLDLPVLARLTPEVMPGLRVLTGLPRAERWTELREAALERVLEVSRLLAQVVVVDCGFNLEDDEELSYDTLAPRRNTATLTSLAASDTVLAVGSADPVGLQRLVRGLQELGTVRSPTPQVVVNRLRASAVGARPESRVSEALLRFAGVVPVTYLPDDQASLDAALLQGRVLAECAPQSPVRSALRSLAAMAAGVPEPSRRSRRTRGRG